MNGWAPRIDRFGNVVSGLGTIDYGGRTILDPGWGPLWMVDGARVACKGEGDRIVAIDVDGTGFEVLGPPAITYAAGKGRCYLANRDAGEIEATIDPKTGELLTLLEHNGNNNDRSIFLEHSLQIARGSIRQVRSYGGFVVWRQHDRTMGFMGGQTLDLGVMPDAWEGNPVPIEAGGEWWVLFQTNVDLRVRPVNSPMGYIIATGEDMNLNPDAMGIGDIILVAWNDKHGNLGRRDISLTQPRTDVSVGLTPPKPAPEPDPVPVPVPAPEPPPVPPPAPTLRDGRFWLGPNIGSTDLLALFDDLSQLQDVGVLQLYIQNILDHGSSIGPNTHAALVAKDAFRKLKAAGIGLAIECGAVKPGNCQALDSIRNITDAVTRVREAGGEVAHVAMDEPLTGAKSGCSQTMARTADYTATFIQHVRRVLKVPSVGWIEAWPYINATDQGAFLEMLNGRDALPSFWHLDIDWNYARQQKASVPAFIDQASAQTKAHGIPLGVILISTQDPIASDAAWFANVHATARTVHGAVPQLAHVIVQSWTSRTGGGQTVPANLGAVGLLASLADARALFGTTPLPTPKPIPVPLPVPVQEDFMIAYGTPIQGFQTGDLHDNGDGSVSVKKGNGTFLCLTPDGKVEERPSPGGAWEVFTVAKNGAALIAARDGGRVYILPLVAVD